VLVLPSADGAAYRAALEGFRARMAELQADVPLRVYEPEQVSDVVAELRRDRPALVVTLGARTTKAVLEDQMGVPLVAGLILQASVLEGSSNATGVVLEFPVEVELEWLHRLLPEGRKVGVLFDPAINGAKIEAAQKAANRAGLTLVPRPVASPQELPDALEALSRRVDVLWGIADNLVLSPATAKSVLTFSYRNRIPFTGLSDAWVEAGAIYALDRDYADIGRQCADLADRVLKGARVDSIPPLRPRKVVYSLNLKAARHMRVEIPTPVVDGAQRVMQ
jgi:putative ABC transport system substrate-binding protein